MDGERHPARFGARTFGPTQRVYSQTKKELLAARLALREERYRILGVTLVLETDCRALLGMLENCTTVDMASCRWLAEIKEYDIIIRHIQGTANVVADWLSRARYGDSREETDGCEDCAAGCATVDTVRTADKTGGRVADRTVFDEQSPEHPNRNASARGENELSVSSPDDTEERPNDRPDDRPNQRPSGSSNGESLERQVLDYLKAAQEGRVLDVSRGVRRRSADYFVAEDCLWRRPRPGFDEWPR